MINDKRKNKENNKKVNIMINDKNDELLSWMKVEDEH